MIRYSHIHVTQLVDDLANRLYAAGKITNKHESESFYTRLIHIEKQFPNASVILHKLGQLPVAVQKFVHFVSSDSDHHRHSTYCH